jgi:hypothetical protein
MRERAVKRLLDHALGDLSITLSWLSRLRDGAISAATIDAIQDARHSAQSAAYHIGLIEMTLFGGLQDSDHGVKVDPKHCDECQIFSETHNPAHP